MCCTDFLGQFHLSSVLLWLYSILFMLPKQLGLLVINACTNFFSFLYLFVRFAAWMPRRNSNYLPHLLSQLREKMAFWCLFMLVTGEYNIIFVCVTVSPPTALTLTSSPPFLVGIVCSWAVWMLDAFGEFQFCKCIVYVPYSHDTRKCVRPVQSRIECCTWGWLCCLPPHTGLAHLISLERALKWASKRNNSFHHFSLLLLLVAVVFFSNRNWIVCLCIWFRKTCNF